MYSNRKRISTFLPINEGLFFDYLNIIRNAAIVASSVTDPPVDGLINKFSFLLIYIYNLVMKILVNLMMKCVNIGNVFMCHFQRIIYLKFLLVIFHIHCVN